MEKKNVTTINEYIDTAPEQAREIMKGLKEIIGTTVPEAEGGISWNVPIYKYHGILAGFDVAKKHVSFGVDSMQEQDRELLEGKGYKTGKKTIQIRFDQQIPEPEIRRLVKEQAKINEL